MAEIFRVSQKPVLSCDEVPETAIAYGIVEAAAHARLVDAHVKLYLCGNFIALLS